MLKRFSKEERSWIMYDWANSVFATIMMAAVFPIFFTGMAGGEGSPGSMWWAWGMVAVQFILGVCAPILGAIIDFKGFKKRLLVTFIVLGAILLVALAFQSAWQLLLLGYVLANIFWSAANIIYDSYLPDVTTKDRMDKVSSWGFGIGYIGGSTIPFVISIALIMFGHHIGIDNTMAVRISILLTAAWWVVFSVPMIKNVHHKYGAIKPQKGVITQTIKNAVATGKKIVKNKGVFMFIIAYFFYIDGVGSVIRMSTAYGAELGLGDTGMIGALLFLQVVAFPFSILFGWLSKKFNPINMITAAIIIYLVICATGFIMGFGLEENWFGVEFATILFWVLAFLVGTVQGGIQAISRATYGKLVPPEHSGEYFGFYEIFGRFSAILGPGFYAIILGITGRPSFAISAIATVFVIGLIVLSFGRKHMKLNGESKEEPA
jgi:UMF1 family MFS transporter